MLYTFPFEGNWNEIRDRATAQLIRLAIHFPVWRELKLFMVIAMRCERYRHLLYTFPFEGNWNPSLGSFSMLRPVCLLYTFPFEGNWNIPRLHLCMDRTLGLAIHFPVWRELKQTIPFGYFFKYSSCYTLSRLKGIETIVRVGVVVASVEGVLAIHFPVWRELKRVHENGVGGVFGLAIHFPVWRELKPEYPSTTRLFNGITCYTLSRLKGIETL